jgi:hypothetical protein
MYYYLLKLCTYSQISPSAGKRLLFNDKEQFYFYFSFKTQLNLFERGMER